MDGRPQFANNFRVLVDGTEIGVAQVSALCSETAPGADGERRVARYRTVVLRRALTGSSELYRWREQAHAGTEASRQVAIEHYDSSGERLLARWELEDAWPCRWSGPALDAADGETVACEELELAFARLKWRTRKER